MPAVEKNPPCCRGGGGAPDPAGSVERDALSSTRPEPDDLEDLFKEGKGASLFTATGLQGPY